MKDKTILDRLELDLEPEPKQTSSKAKRSRKITRPKRSAVILVRVFTEEKDRIEVLAKEHLMTPSEYIRSVALGNLTQSDIDALIEQRALEKLEKIKEQYFNLRIVGLSWTELWGLRGRLKKELKKLKAS